MTGSETTGERPAEHAEETVTGIETTPELPQNDSAVTDLWDIEETLSPHQNDGLSNTDNLTFELETLTIEKERLKKENKRLAEMLEAIKIEEDIAALKEEVNMLGGQNEHLLAEIQRRRQSIGK